VQSQAVGSWELVRLSAPTDGPIEPTQSIATEAIVASLKRIVSSSSMVRVHHEDERMNLS